jgi:N-acetylglucosaminyl-diphospho-decaprenol L-rhamnosyltransferase
VAPVKDSRLLLSVVSHRQADLVLPFLKDLETLRQPGLQVVLTLNVEEPWPHAPEAFRPPLRILRNAQPKGFGANHNAAFRAADCDFFCVANPDIRLRSNPFPALLACAQDPRTGAVAPRVLGADGKPEDNARRFPTLPRLARKLLNGAAARLDYADAAQRSEPDWIAGMFMLFRRDAFARVGGFDERYFLYYEDVDLCARLRLAGLRAVLEPRAEVVHLAQRQSRRSARYAWWHARSMARWLASQPCRRVTGAKSA